MANCALDLSVQSVTNGMIFIEAKCALGLSAQYLSSTGVIHGGKFVVVHPGMYQVCYNLSFLCCYWD